MWLKWLPWRMAVRRLAKTNGFLDPFSIVEQLRRFAQPAEVAIPLELVRLSSILQARGLINNQAIQHNLDWVWPFWVERQFNPGDDAFIPRSFSLSHINLTHRNWTAAGIPDCPEYPIIDPAGLVTPFFDSWSIDSWLMMDSGTEVLIPSRQPLVSQKLLFNDSLAILTESSSASLRLSSRVEVIGTPSSPVCRIQVSGTSTVKGWCIVALRPYNPEGVSFIHRIQLLEGHHGWKVNGKSLVYLNQIPDRCLFSDYRNGDVYHFLPHARHRQEVVCDVGLATAAAVFELKPDQSRGIVIDVPLKGKSLEYKNAQSISTHGAWDKALENTCRIKIPDSKYQFLYDAAVRTVVLHAPQEVYPGPYTYKHFWFRDAAFILQAMLCTGLFDRVEKVIESCFFSRQNAFGYFHSQDGEWDANGQALWTLKQFCRLSGRPPKPEWKRVVEKGAHWIQRKRLPAILKEAHAGLLPAGFSAEHLGPNDFYYWDDFWGAAGLLAAADLEGLYGDTKHARLFEEAGFDFLKSIELSLNTIRQRLGHSAIPASPYRRMDSGAIGSLAGGYPLQLWEPADPRLQETVRYLMKECFFEGGFFHDMSHSGINPYLSLHIAQTLLRAGDARYYEVMKAVADLASSTGQWPEAVHPKTKGGCMGDGQHVWAAAEWILMLKNCFVREEKDSLILFSGIPKAWLESKEDIRFGPVITSFGRLQMSLKHDGEKMKPEWQGEWRHGTPPKIEVRLQESVRPVAGRHP